MKKLLSVICFIFCTTVIIDTFADIVVLTHEYKQSPGVKDVRIKTEVTTRRLTQQEINDENNIKKNSKILAYSYQAVAHDAFGIINQNVQVFSDHSACFKNTETYAQQYGYRFNLSVLSDYVESSESFMMDPGFERCIKQSMFMTVIIDVIGEYKIKAITHGAEGSSSNNTVSGEGMLTIK